MAVGGGNLKAQKIAKLDGQYWVMQVEDRPAHILSEPELARDGLMSGLTVWIAAMDNAKLGDLLGVKIKHIHTRGSNGTGTGTGES